MAHSSLFSVSSLDFSMALPKASIILSPSLDTQPPISVDFLTRRCMYVFHCLAYYLLFFLLSPGQGMLEMCYCCFESKTGISALHITKK